MALRRGLMREVIRRRRPHIPALSLVAALLFFFGPAIAFTFGDRDAPLENRPLAGMPSMNSGWHVIPGFNAWAVDHLPLRSQAVRAQTYLSEAVFGEPPPSAAPRVIQGKNNWLYLADDFSSACNPKLSLAAVIDGLKRLRTAIDVSGRKLVISVIPDKSTAVPQNLPESFAFKNCGEERRREFWQEIVASEVPFVNVREPLAAAERAARHPMYLKLNTHWNMQGAAVWTKSILGTLDRRLIEGLAIPGVDEGAPPSESSFVAGPVTDQRGDLTVMLGAPRTEPMLPIALQRRGVTLSSEGVRLPGNVPPQTPQGTAGPPITTKASTSAAPLYPGRTLILGDSFYASARSLFAPFMSTLTAVYVIADPAKIMPSIIDADTVVLEVVERNLSSGWVPLIRPDALAELERSLTAHHR
jgi:alginate O-acetyltransferase complex protein AlgJ